jgi:hypothetical protein
VIGDGEPEVQSVHQHRVIHGAPQLENSNARSFRDDADPSAPVSARAVAICDPHIEEQLAEETKGRFGRACSPARTIVHICSLTHG